MKVLVTGCNGLIGSEAVCYYSRRGHETVGIDNNMRARFFGRKGDTTWNLARLKRDMERFEYRNIDIRSRQRLFGIFRADRFDCVIHCAAQPSHDKAAAIPLVDFEVNALGTLNLLEATRKYCPEATFIFMSSNKVYGDVPNELPLVELSKRFDYGRTEDWNGISEECRIDRCLHSLFGASKAAGDILAQEYGRYYGLNVGVFRGGCLTGPWHSSVEQHGFLSYLVKTALSDSIYKVFGYGGKQVRDNIHSLDVIEAMEAFRRRPRPGEVYNIGGGRDNSISILEAFELIKRVSGYKVRYEYLEPNRKGDHVCYISDLRKFQTHFPDWRVRRSLEQIVSEMVETAVVGACPNAKRGSVGHQTATT